MTKVFIIHGFGGSPNGGWRPWLMRELEKQDVYACALSMPSAENPVYSEWIDEISLHVNRNSHDKIYLVGHSLGVPAILRYMEETTAVNISGAVLVSGPSQKTNNNKIDTFLNQTFDFEKIKSKCKKFAVIHGDIDSIVPLDNARFLSQELDAPLVIVKNGGHLNGSAGWFELPPCLDALKDMLKESS